MVGEEKATTRGFLKEEYINLGSLKVTVKYLLLHFPSLSNFVLRFANYFSPWHRWRSQVLAAENKTMF